MNKKLYAIVTCPISDNAHQKVFQVSFNKEELEEIATYLNSFPYFSPRATVEEVTQSLCEWCWPE